MSIDHVSPRTNNVRRRGYPGIRDGDDEDPMDDDSEYITEQHAVELIRNPVAETHVSTEVEEAVWRRIAG